MTDRWGYYLNCGSGQPGDKVIDCGVQPDEYLDSVKKSVQYIPSFIGSCCGSSPAHTKKIREYLDGKVNS
jgi:homocysteine S-methyltransferase